MTHEPARARAAPQLPAISTAIAGATPGPHLGGDAPRLPQRGIDEAGFLRRNEFWQGVGVVPGIYTGLRHLPVYESDWHEYVFFGHAPGAFQSLFVAEGPDLSTGTDYASRVRITPSDPVVEFLMPGNATWNAVFGSSAPYRDFNGNRYTVCYGFGPRSELARTGKVPLVANLWGVEDVGDGTGDVITSLALQVCHLLLNFVLQNYTSGTWLSAPSVDGYSRIKTASFEACKTRSEARISGGHLGAFLLGWDGGAKTLADLVRMIAVAGIDLGTNNDGQIIGSMIDPSATLARAVSDVTDTLKASFRARRRRDEILNAVSANYKRRYTPSLAQLTPEEGQPLPPSLTKEESEWEAAFDVTPDSASVTKYGTRAATIDLELVRDQATAEDVAQLYQHVRAAGPLVNTFTEGLCGTNVDLGDRITLDHFEGVTAAGFDDESMRCERHTLDLDAMTVETDHLDPAGLS